MKNFYITGFGRSGTTFLAKMMNKSNKWTVNHEARGYDDMSKDNIIAITNTFQKPYYGEVNNYLRKYIGKIPMCKVGIITRDTQDIFLSMANRRQIGELKWRINGLHEMYTQILPKWQDKVYMIEFDKLTSDKDYLQQVFLDFGIDDIDMDTINLKSKVNGSTGKWYNTWDELPDDHKQLYYSLKW